MITYKFSVSLTEVTLTESDSEVTQGNINVIKCVFDLSDEYNGLDVDAVFNGVRVPIINGECYAPSIDGFSCIVGVVGYKIEEGEYKVRISPTPTSFKVNNGSYSDSLKNYSASNPSQVELYYNNLLSILSNGKLRFIDIAYDRLSYNRAGERFYKENLASDEYCIIIIAERFSDNDGYIVNKSINIWTIEGNYYVGDVSREDMESQRYYIDKSVSNVNKEMEKKASIEYVDSLFRSIVDGNEALY